MVIGSVRKSIDRSVLINQNMQTRHSVYMFFYRTTHCLLGYINSLPLHILENGLVLIVIDL